jgi:hypothetical protein
VNTSIVRRKTAKENIYVYQSVSGKIYKVSNFTPDIGNGLADQDAQEIRLDIEVSPKQNYITRQHRNFNKHSIDGFLTNLSYENWKNVFNSDEVNVSFNNFLNTYLRIFNSNFISKPIQFKHNNTTWITKGIRVSCNHKRELYILSREMKDANLTLYYKQYCKILTKVILTAKKLYYDSKIANSNDKMKTTWEIVKKETGNKNYSHKVQALEMNSVKITDQNAIANSFNKYFVSIADKNTENLESNTPNQGNIMNPIKLMRKNFINHCPKINWSYTSTAEVNRIIKSLKSKNSSGYENIPVKILKMSASFILSPLTYICNKTLSTRKFPDRLKYAIVKPSYKKLVK